MASKNKLLGSGVVEKSEPAVEKEPVSVFKPILLHYPLAVGFGSKLITTAKEFEEAVEKGWKDHPGKVAKLPGWEHLYEE